ncbi:hypothetical protein VTI74DRAFT_9750 [Chaetomium olivicolor]
MSSKFLAPSPGSQPPPSTQQTLDNDIPPLSLEVLTTRADKAAALKLIADSIAQQRQEASFHLVFHPLLLPIPIAALAAVYRYAWASNTRHDLGTAMMLASGAIMTYLLAIRYLTSGYLRAAEAISWDFLNPESANGQEGEEDIVLGTRYGGEIIGALVLRLSPPSSQPTKSATTTTRQRNRQSSPTFTTKHLKGGHGLIRAWTTKLRYRGKGVGVDMLREAVRITQEKCGKDAEVTFASDHANSLKVLPAWVNGPERKREEFARKAFEDLIGRVR